MILQRTVRGQRCCSVAVLCRNFCWLQAGYRGLQKRQPNKKTGFLCARCVQGTRFPLIEEY